MRDKKTGFLGYLGALSGRGEGARAEKARLEAFLSAIPGEYCGWGTDGSIAYSKGFCDLFGVDGIRRLSDVQNGLVREDGIMLDSMFNRLMSDGIPFVREMRRRDGKILKVSGTRGEDLAQADCFYILWAEQTGTQDGEEADDEKPDPDRFQDMLDALPYPVWLRDKTQKIIWCNIAYAKALKLTTGEIVAQQKEILSGARKRKPSEKNVLTGAELAQHAWEEGKAQTIELHEVLGGERRLMRVSEIPERARHITVGFAQDVTEQERVRDEIKSNHTANRALLEQLRSAIAIYDTDHRLDFYNASFAQLWGLEEGWLNTKPKLGDIMEKLRETRRLPEQADFKSFKKSWLAMFTDLIEPYEDMLYLPDGAAFRMLVVPHRLGGLMMTFEDVSGRLALESSYNTLVAVQKETLDNLAEGVCVYGGDGRLKLWNPAFAHLWGFDPETLEGQPHITGIVGKMDRFFDPEQWAATKELMISLGLERAINKGRLERNDGLLLAYATVPLPDGGVLMTCADITDSARVENALRERTIALETAEKLKLDFLANVSYQLRTPLNAIMGFNDMLEQEFFGPLNDRQKGYTGDIHKASGQLLALINDILDLSTIEAGQMTLERTETPVREMMDNILDLVEGWARKQGIEMTLHCPANIGKAWIDQTRIKQAVINLVRNSIAHTSQGGTITLEAVRRKEGLKIVVGDNGSGIEEENQRRVLEPFERIEKDTQGARGAGLGLALVRSIVALHHGTFDLESVPGKGTTVTMVLPRTEDDQVDEITH